MIKKHWSKILVILLLIVIMTGGFRCKTTSQEVREAMKPVKLIYWGVWDTPEAINFLINDYRVLHPHVSIEYRKLRNEEYEQALKEAWLDERGPDIFAIPITWLEEYKHRLLPLPDKITMPYVQLVGPSCKREEEIVLKTQASLNLGDIRQKFVGTIYDDVVEGEQIYGLPLSLDSLVLYYNRDLLNTAGIPQPPTNWTEFKNQVQKLTFQDEKGNIVQAGVALGTANNVRNATDILSLLMMQNGTPMIQGRKATFNLPSTQREGYYPGEEALRFYTDFANPAKEVYTWNSQMPDSLDAFIEGRVAFYFGYSYDLATIQSRAPKLNFSITTMPQIKDSLQSVNSANYWIQTVYWKTEHANEAWDFIQFMATNEDSIKKYLDVDHRPTALNSLYNQQIEDYDLRPFVKQILTAQTWYNGQNYPAVEEAFKEMINKVLRGEATIKQAILYGVGAVNLTF
jgi:multiple sugar transport system substrate-binding protein